ncbi:(2Fe-2S)-binding protein [bacterium]|nr:(2Fe-2S)-binding protein [bacterium]
MPTGEAHTLTADEYLSPEVYEREREAIFSRTWQIVARTADLTRPGDFVPANILDEPIVLVHGLDGTISGFHNVCRHRAGQVALSKGNRKSLQCRYHGWTYGLDGALKNCPEMDQTEGFRKEDFGLIPVRTAVFGPFIFANLSADAPPLEEVLGAIPSEIAAAGFPMDEMQLVERRDYIVECNWKVYVDNYLEGYHIPDLKEGEVHGVDRRFIRSGEGEDDALYYWCFPNMMLNLYPDNLSLNLVIPLGPNRTLTIFEWYFASPGTGPGWESMQQGIAFSDQIQQEDIVICEQVQRGLKSSAYTSGRFSALRENGVHHFQSLVREFLASETTPR